MLAFFVVPALLVSSTFRLTSTSWRLTPLLFKEPFLLQLSDRAAIDKVIELSRLDLGRIDSA